MYKKNFIFTGCQVKFTPQLDYMEAEAHIFPIVLPILKKKS